MDNLLKNFASQADRKVITAAVHNAFVELKGLEKGQLGEKLAEFANLPIGAEMGKQLKADLPDFLNSLKVSLSKRQYSTTDKSMAELAVLQARSVQAAWTEIRSSKELTARSEKIIASIEKRLKVMEDDYCVKIRKLLAASESEKFTEAQKKTILSQMKTLYIGLRTEYITATTDISEWCSKLFLKLKLIAFCLYDTNFHTDTLKLDIDGQMIRLEYQNKQQTDLIVQNLVVGVAGTVKDAYNDNWEGATEKVCNTGVNVLESILTKRAIGQEIGKLKNLLDQVALLETRLAEVANVKKQAEEFLKANGVDPAKL